MILVTGATGNVGSEAARLLAARHQPTRALRQARLALRLSQDEMALLAAALTAWMPPVGLF